MNQGARSRQQRLSRILESASHVFAENDYAEVSLEEVAHRAGVARGTIYNYFGSKEHLYQKVLAERLGALMERLEDVLHRERDPRANLTRCVVQPFLFFVKYPNLLMLWRRNDLRRTHLGDDDQADLNMRVIDVRTRLSGLLKDVISQGVSEGVFRTVKPEPISHSIMGAVEGAAGALAGSDVRGAPVRAARSELMAFVEASLVNGATTGGGAS